MRNIYLITAALVSMILASCANEEIVGNEAGTGTTTNGVISFGGLAPAMTRAELYGNAAATKLKNKFVVYGTKHNVGTPVNAEDKTADNDVVQFNNFQVAYTASTAGTTASNTSDWEYVGLQAYDAKPTSQGIKYWDYSATQGYTFYAFSSPDISYPMDATNDKVQVVKTKSDVSSLYNKGYEVTIKDASKLSNLYFSDRVEVPKADYDKTVDLTFRNIGTKVRFGFYETIPGYKVTIDEFLIDADASAAVTSFAAMKDKKADGFYASLQNVKTSADQTINVTYYDNTDEKIKNQPKVSNPTGGYDYSIKLGDASTIIGKELATTSYPPTWVNGTTDGYATVFPFEGNTNPLLVKLNFTMTAEDGSGDVIKVRGARAIIPAKYVQWKGNFAYTYIFKISDKTNGTTGEIDGNGDPTDPEGLKPITFDAIVVDITDERQETITSVSTRSITTYAGGEIVNEYTASKPIYVSISNSETGAVITPSDLGNAAGQAQIYKLNKAASEAEVYAQLTGSPMGITFTAESTTLGTTIPLVDGTTPSISNVNFTPSAASSYYAYVYTTTAYIAPTYNSEASGTYDSSKTYYMKSESGAYFAVTVRNKEAYDANKANLYTIATAGTPGVYDIKVIKVQ